MSLEDPGYHQLAPNLQESVDAHHVRFLAHIQQMREALAHPELNLKPAYNLDHLLKTHPELVPEFESDPRGFARQRVGLELPEGFHVHYIDPTGKYWPQAANTVSATEESDETPWARAEIRITIRNATGVGTIVIGLGDSPVSGGIPYVPPGTATVG